MWNKLILGLTLLFGSTICIPAQLAKIVDVNANDDTINVDIALRNIPVIVSDRQGRNVLGLKKEDFFVQSKNSNKKLPIELLADHESPMRLMLVIDTSSSARFVLGRIIKDAQNFISFLRPEDEGLVMTFDRTVNTLQEFTSDQKKLRKGLGSASVEQEIGSNMNDALYNLMTKDRGHFNGRKAIIVLTDGDVGGNVEPRELYSAFAETDALIYPIFYQTRRLFPSSVESITYEKLFTTIPGGYLNSVAKATGGRVFAAEGSDFTGAFQNVADELKKQYIVTISADKIKDLDDMRIGVRREGVFVRHKIESAQLGPPTLKETGMSKKN